MQFHEGHDGREREIFELFTAVFTASEGTVEGETVGKLVRDLMKTVPDDDLFVFTARDDGVLVGSILFSRLNYDQDNRTVFILSPVAVKPNQQNEGIGQKLLTFGLEALRRKGIDVVMTYGNPDYYSKVGFRQISPEFALPPFELTQPHGWLAQPLSATKFEPLVGPSRCVEALNKPHLW